MKLTDENWRNLQSLVKFEMLAKRLLLVALVGYTAWACKCLLKAEWKEGFLFVFLVAMIAIFRSIRWIRFEIEELDER